MWLLLSFLEGGESGGCVFPFLLCGGRGDVFVCVCVCVFFFGGQYVLVFPLCLSF